MVVEQALIGEFGEVFVRETALPEEFLECSTKVGSCWREFLKTHPKATKDPKVRLTAYSVAGDTIILYLSKGIDFSHVIYTGELNREGDGPKSPAEIYEKGNKKYFAKNPLSNALSVAGVVILDPNKSYDLSDKEMRILFSIRSGSQATQKSTLTLMVNGYVDDGRIETPLLKANLYREMEEESYIKKWEILDTSFVGPSQMHGKSCDLVWVLRSELSYDEWKERWKTAGGQEESAGVLALPATKLGELFSEEGRKRLILEEGLIGDKMRKRIQEQGIKLNSLVQSLSKILTKDKLSKYLQRMRAV